MSGHRHEGALGAVYEAKTPGEVARLYDGWAESYDAEMAKAGYRHPSICLALISRHLPRGSAPLLDAGAGTGLVGEWLGIIGYPEVEALDISKGMLAVAAAKNVYTRLHEAALGSPLPFADGHFAGVVSAGVFTTGHVGPEGLDELVRICRPGGVIVLTVKTSVWQNGFAGRISELAGAGRLAIEEQTEPYVSMPGETGTVPSVAVVLKVMR
ncbi:MAG: class I SAM-dependent methyltransferase [Anderseniella sp.]|nr:class I SAM-dependent methyltransferase [Anderseniella sp.]